jgi:6-phosphofructokinase 1
MMSKLIGSLLLGQSGGPTSVINASAYGVFKRALESDSITNILAAEHGIVVILREEFIDIRQEDESELEYLNTTPSSSIGSVRYKLADYKKDDTDYKTILEVFRKYNIRYFFYNGGNDSMDTCQKISEYLASSGFECRCIGIPKTIDNDLPEVDHSPGFASAAKYIATTFSEVERDATVYNNKQVTIIEVMGRNAGWLTASASLASLIGNGPDLMYLPEIPFDIDEFYKTVLDLIDKKGKIIIAISEGVKTKENKYIPQYYENIAHDSFGHAQLGGTAYHLAGELQKRTKAKVRSIELSLLQRCAAHIASKVDIEEAFLCGYNAVKFAESGITNKMVGVVRSDSLDYKAEYKLFNLDSIANKEKSIPLSWIKENNTGVTQDYINYLLPLIQGENKIPYENGMPRYANLKKVRFALKD